MPGNIAQLWFWYGCCGDRMLVELYYGFGTDALVTVRSWNMSVIAV